MEALVAEEWIEPRTADNGQVLFQVCGPFIPEVGLRSAMVAARMTLGAASLKGLGIENLVRVEPRLVRCRMAVAVIGLACIEIMDGQSRPIVA